MTSFWLVAGALTLAILAIVFVPFLRYRGSGRGRMDYDVSVYADQLKEVDRDIERGLLGAPEAETAKLEIQRRMLAAAEADTAEDARKETVAGPLNKGLAAALAGVVAAGALSVYALVGSPGLPDQPHAERRAAAMGVDQAQAEKILGMVEGLAAKMKANPDDVEGWKLLGRSYMQTGSMDKSAEAYREALSRGADDVETLFNFAMALSRANDNTIVPQARQALLIALGKAPEDPDILSYVGMAAVQDGDAARGIGIWKHLLSIAPPHAPYRQGVEQLISAVAADFKVDAAAIAAVKPEPLAMGPMNAAPQAEAGAGAGAPPGGFSPEMMVARLEKKLAESPDDLAGWLRLGNAYRVLKRFDDSVVAYEKAAVLDPKSTEPLIGLTKSLAARAQADGAATFPPRAVEAMKTVLTLEATNADALYFLGLAAFKEGDKVAARDYWTRLRDSFPEGSSDRDQAQQFLDGLK